MFSKHDGDYVTQCTWVTGEREVDEELAGKMLKFSYTSRRPITYIHTNIRTNKVDKNSYKSAWTSLNWKFKPTNFLHTSTKTSKSTYMTINEMSYYNYF